MKCEGKLSVTAAVSLQVADQRIMELQEQAEEKEREKEEMEESMHSLRKQVKSYFARSSQFA